MPADVPMPPRPSRPPSRGSEEELGKLLDEFEDLVADRTFVASKASSVSRQNRANTLAEEARQSIESYVSRLRQINHALVESNGILIGESIGLTAALASLKEQNERLQQDIYRYDDALGRGLTDEERAKTYE